MHLITNEFDIRSFKFVVLRLRNHGSLEPKVAIVYFDEADYFLVTVVTNVVNNVLIYIMM